MQKDHIEVYDGERYDAWIGNDFSALLWVAYNITTTPIAPTLAFYQRPNTK